MRIERSHYEEGRTLMNRATEKIADKYNLSVMCLVSRQDQPDHSLHLTNMSADTMASFLVSLLTKVENKKLMRKAVSLMPDRLLFKVLGLRFALFYMAMGAGVWSAFELLAGLLRRITVN